MEYIKAELRKHAYQRLFAVTHQLTTRSRSGDVTLALCVLLTLSKRDGHAIDAQFSATADAFRKAMRALK